MTSKEKAAEAKAKGNASFQAKNYKESIEHFTEAIKHDPSDHVFFSNRSACYASLEQYDQALKDGAECVRLKPDWPKGYTRKGLAEFFLNKLDDAAKTYEAGLKLAPEDAALKEGLKKVMDAKYEVPHGAPMMPKLDPSGLLRAQASNPKIKKYMEDPELMKKINTLMGLSASGNGQMQAQMLMQLLQQDRRVLEVLMAAQGVDLAEMEAEEDLRPRQAPTATSANGGGVKRKREPSPAPQPEDTRSASQKEADDFKTQGNALYKKRKFDEAIESYDKAIEKEPNDLTYHNNRCAVLVEKGEENYEKVLAICQDLIDRRYEINTANPGGASFEKVAKVFNRMASVYEKQRDFDKAIAYYNKALTEDNNRQTRNALRECERLKEKHEKDAYLDDGKAEEHREKGNASFKEGKWAEAKAEYDEAIRRNPKDPKLYSNRAAALTKLCAHPDALRDLEECLKLDPKFVKAYSRKGTTHFFMKEYNKALAAYDSGLKLDPTNEECKKGRAQVIDKIMSTQNSEVDEEQVAHALADPEIQQILHDPRIKIFLKQLQESPGQAQEAMTKDPQLRNVVNKLVAAGIIRTR